MELELLVMVVIDLYIGTGGTDGSGNANSIDVVGGKYFTTYFLLQTDKRLQKN